MIHELKILRGPFEDVRDGRKTFEYRRDDREVAFGVGDMLLLREFCPRTAFSGDYTGRTLLVNVVYKLDGEMFGVPKGFCVLGIERQEAVTLRKPEPTGEYGELAIHRATIKCRACGHENDVKILL